MSLKTKQDYYNIADGVSVVCVKSDEGHTHSLAEVHGQDGSIVAADVYGDTRSPSCDYQLKAQLVTEKSGNTDTLIKLGKVVTVDEMKFCLGSFTISTAAGAAPTISAGGEQVADDATQGCVYEIPAFTLPTTHHAQILFSAFSLSGTGNHLQSASYAGSATISKATKDGVCLAHDVVEGKIEAQISIMQVGSTPPTVTPGSGWEVSAPLDCSNPDSDHATWSMTLVKYLAKA
jgi:hypothetical protein